MRALALRYVERYATTEAKLRTYLARKLREREWQSESPPDPEALCARFVALGYVDDRIYGEAKARSLSARGYGARRVEGALRQAGVADGLRANISETLNPRQALLSFAKRRRFGPYSRTEPDERTVQKQMAAMMRAGHGFDDVRRLMQAASGAELEAEWQDDDAP
nr:RecX family transcriptional regulator [Pacificimonas pallii]